MQNDTLHPTEISFKDIWINSLWALIAWISGSVLLLVFVLVSSSIYDIPGEFSNDGTLADTKNIFFPFFMSFLTFFITTIVLFASYIFLTYTSPEKYSRSSVTYTQIALLWTLVYLFITPVYLYAWMTNYDNIIYVFVAHVLILYYVLMIILELLNDYRYILVWLYAATVSTLLTWTISIFIFWLFPTGTAKLFFLLLLIPLVNCCSIFFKWLFEYVYYLYYKHTWNDNLWDIFRQIELESEEQLRQVNEENTL
jgi:hypothetical protein